MSKVYESILELVGHTPIVHLNRIEKEENTLASIYAKVEFFNPAGSVKDRIALNMINEAENAGLIKKNNAARKKSRLTKMVNEIK